jgi:hypothetical protein
MERYGRRQRLRPQQCRAAVAAATNSKASAALRQSPFNFLAHIRFHAGPSEHEPTLWLKFVATCPATSHKDSQGALMKRKPITVLAVCCCLAFTVAQSAQFDQRFEQSELPFRNQRSPSPESSAGALIRNIGIYFHKPFLALRCRSTGWRLYGRVDCLTQSRTRQGLAPEAPTLKLPRVISSDDWNAVNRLSVVMVSICNTALALFAPWCSCTRTTFADLSTFGGWPWRAQCACHRLMPPLMYRWDH